MDTKSKTVCFVDNGLYVSFARKLAPEFKKAYYYSSWQCAFPTSRQLLVGDGFDEMERVNFPLEIADEVDLWVFLDLYHSDLQLFLERHGARVFGARGGEDIELYRWEFKQHLKRIGLPVVGAEKIIGTAALREHLKKVTNKYVKTSFVRGDFETFRHDNFELSEPRLDELEHVLGAAKRQYEFLVEDEIPNAVEVGYDGVCVDGKFPRHAMMAYEVKDVGMIGCVKEYDKLALPIRYVNDKLSSTLKGYEYRGFLSTEIRYTADKKSYLIDPCCRCGTPSNELLQELFDGWSEVLWAGAEGVVKDLAPKERFGVLAVIHSEWAVENWQSLRFPKELDKWVKLRFHTRIEGDDYVVPQPIGMPDLGCVVAVGETLEKAIRLCKERAKLIKGYGVEVAVEGIDKAIEVIEKGKKFGISF